MEAIFGKKMSMGVSSIDAEDPLQGGWTLFIFSLDDKLIIFWGDFEV